MLGLLLVGAAAVIVGAMPVQRAYGQTNPVKLMKGVISDAKTGRPIDGGRLFVYTSTSTESIAFSKINPKTGFYQLILAPSTNYRFEIVSPRYHTTSFTVVSPAGNNYEETIRDLKVEPIPIGQLVYNGRPFASNSSTLTPNATLKGLVDMMKRERSVVITVTVMADMAAPAPKKPAAAKKPKKGAAPVAATAPTATVDPLRALVEQRTTALKDYFKAQGVSLARIQWVAVTTPARTKDADNVVAKITGVQSQGDSDDEDN